MKLRQQELTGDGGRPGQVGGGRRQSCRTDVSSGGVAARPGGDRRQHADDSHQPADRRRRWRQCADVVAGSHRASTGTVATADQSSSGYLHEEDDDDDVDVELKAHAVPSTVDDDWPRCFVTARLDHRPRFHDPELTATARDLYASSTQPGRE